MDAIRQYILSVICMAVLCGLAQMLVPGKGSMVKLITGIMIVITAASPLRRNGSLSWNINFDQIKDNGNWAVMDGEQAAYDTASVFIREKMETYILDKAAELGAEVTVTVSVNEALPPIPTKVTITGAVSPYAKKQLGVYIQRQLGIAEGNQIWSS